MTGQELKDRAISAVGTAAGAAADPRTAVAQFKRRVPRGRLGMIAATLLVAYLLGRRSAQRR